MAELSDIVTATTISSDRANEWQDRLIQRYSSVANRTTEHGSPSEGDLSYLQDSNTVWVYNGSAWVNIAQPVQPADLAASVLVDPVRAGGAQHITSGGLTTTLTDKASVVFTKPSGWTTYALVAWGSAIALALDSSAPSGVSALSARVEIGASNGATNTAPTTTAPDFQTVPCFHSVTAQTASPVTVVLAAAGSPNGGAVYDSSTISYIAHRLT